MLDRTMQTDASVRAGGPEPVSGADAMGMLIRETYRAMTRKVEREFDGSELILSHWLTLKLTGAGKISCIGDISRELGFDSGASTRLVDHLEIKGLLRRRRSRGDRRVVALEVTDKGRQMIDGMAPRLIGFWDRQLSIFSPSERAALFAMVTRLRDALLPETEAGPRQ